MSLKPTVSVPSIKSSNARYGLFTLWVLVAASALYLYFFHREGVRSELEGALSTPTVIAAVIYLSIRASKAAAERERQRLEGLAGWAAANAFQLFQQDPFLFSLYHPGCPYFLQYRG